MTTKSTNKNLRKANAAKKDEFYTQLVDIEKELKHYKEQFRGKVVYCNCDDPFESNFFKYFAANFNALGLKKLVTTSYVKSPIVGGQLPLFEVEGLKPSGKEPFIIEIKEVPDTDKDGAINLDDVEYLLKHDKNTATPLKGDGDFRSEECIELLKDADIVVTNPPFSFFREFVAQLVKFDKKFLILGNMNAITYKEIFKLIRENRIWSGYGFNMSIVYKTPYVNNLEANRKFVVGKGYNPDEGYVKVPAINWFTNLDTEKRHEKLDLYKSYSPDEYIKFDNYDAININAVREIPKNFNGAMGVPITFLDKYNPEQFEIFNALNRYQLFDDDKLILNRGDDRIGRHMCSIDNGQRFTYFRIIIKKRKK